MNNVFSKVNISKDYSTISNVNAVIDRFHKVDGNKLKLVALARRIQIEAYGDSAFDEHNEIGYCMVLRSDESEAVNLIGWRSIKSARRAWSTLAAETHAMEFVMDRNIGMKLLFQELGLDRSQTTVMTDNLR